MEKMSLKEFGEKILRDAINRRINFIDQQASRIFNPHIDLLNIVLTERQFHYVQVAFNLISTYVICKGVAINSFEFEGFECKPKYNSRMGKYEILCTSKEYINDFDKRFDYLDQYIN